MINTENFKSEPWNLNEWVLCECKNPTWEHYTGIDPSFRVLPFQLGLICMCEDLYEL